MRRETVDQLVGLAARVVERAKKSGAEIAEAIAIDSLDLSAKVRMGAPDPRGTTKQLMLLVSGAIAARHVQGVADSALAARQVAEALVAHPRGRTGVGAVAR